MNISLSKNETSTSPSLLDLANRTVLREDAESNDYVTFYEAFKGRKFHILVKEVGEGQVGVAFRDGEGLQSLVTSESQQLLHEQLETSGLALREVTGFAILRMTESVEFVLGIMEGAEEKDWFFLTHDQLVLLYRIANIQAAPADARALDDHQVYKMYPKAFLDWLYRYCRENPDIERCWFVIVAIGSANNLDVVVVLDSQSDTPHLARIRERAKPEFAANVSVLDEQGLVNIAAQDVSTTIRANKPLFDRRHKQHPLARLARALRRHPFTFLTVNLTQE
ncbi:MULTISPECIES: hypothetical protein [unclassified Modicisalibacter]|uniref:hypothetical protein n=1 Tax=unclassified Modicisalibacter TaxID=2679913 RepID=UPI001CC97C1B|nr:MULTISPECIES: hypothetical protein [unclassified Modicisalibacter]MBZ9558588.1 hypothetical protein [Modicisalibacter sp. R2A 31.J]MBZ9575520.1 hypothetical protein [Modicisalibacter sp. MOD 31.J]